MKSNTTLISFIIVFSFSLFGQEVSVKYLEDQDIKTYFNRPIGVDSKGFIYNYDHLDLFGSIDKVFLRVIEPENGEIISNSKIGDLSFLQELNLELLGSTMYPEETCTVQNGQLHIFAKGKSNGEEGIFIFRLNELLELTDEPFFMSTKASNCAGKCEHMILVNNLNSKNSNSTFTSKVYSGKRKDEISEFQLLTFDNENKLLSNEEIIFDNRKVNDVDFIKVKGKTFMEVEAFTRQAQEGNLLGFLSKEDVYTDHVYVKDEKDVLKEIDIKVFGDGYKLESANIQEIDGDIIITGKLVKDDLFQGVGSIVIDAKTLNQKSQRSFFFDSGIADGYEDVRFSKKRRLNDSRDEIVDGKFSNTYELVKTTMNKSGNIINVYQNKYVMTYGESTIYRHTNVLVVNIMNNGIVKNVTYLPIKQSIVNKDYKVGLRTLMYGDDLHIIHMTIPKITKAINEVNGNSGFKSAEDKVYRVGLTTVNHEGEVNSQGLIDTSKEGLFYSARDIVVDENNKVIHMVSTPQYATGGKPLRMATISIE